MQGLDWLDYAVIISLVLAGLALIYLIYTLRTLHGEIEWKAQDWND
jgi:hypothetical protein